MNLEKLESSLFLANVMYGLEMNPDDFIEIALVAWNRIGNKYHRLYRFDTRIDHNSLTVELPCNADIVEAVTYNFEDWDYTANDRVNGDRESQFIETYIESRKAFRNPMYLRGKLARFTQQGQTLHFDKDYGNIHVLYKGIFIDEDGLPYINDKERDAIACFVAFTYKFKQGWQSNNPNLINLAQTLEAKWKKLCDQARVPVQFSQNEMDEILDAAVSSNRKIFNKPYKPWN